MKKDYVSVVYDKKRKPESAYPSMLTAYLFNRFKMKGGERLLELGCGRGDFLLAFQDLGLECDGIDRSDFCLKKEIPLRVKCLDISRDELPFADNSFDVVYHKSVLEHFYNPDNLMKETYRVLKPGGKVIILTPDWVSQMRVFYEDFTHCRPYNIMALCDLLRVYGFAEARAELFYQLPILWKYSFLKSAGKFLQLILSVPQARRLARLSGIKFFRWSVELMVLGIGVKQKLENSQGAV